MQATGSSFFTQAMALATANTASTALPELLAFMTSRLGQNRANALVQKVGHLLTLEQQYTLQETYLYGSSRLGVKNQQLTLSTRIASVQNGSLTPIGNAILNTDSLFTGTAAVYGLPKAPTARVFNRTWGLKQYELSNHLGNVQVTVSDKKIGVLSSNQVDFVAYEPEVKSATDYYAYGMEMPGKTYQSTAYRYGMNTQEKDNEIYGPGNTLGALYWEYDARTARRWNVDPVVKEYEGGYTTFGGNPIWSTDINGDDSLKVNSKTGNVMANLPEVTISAEKIEPATNIVVKLLERVKNPEVKVGELVASTALFISTDLSIPDPSDLYLPKYVAYAAVGVCLYLLNKYSNNSYGFGDPKNWVYTYRPSSEDPINRPPRPNDPNEAPPNLRKSVKLLVAAKLLYEIRDEYNQRLSSPIIPSVSDNTRTIPSLKPKLR